MPGNHESLIAALVEDLEPVRPLRAGRGAARVALAAALTAGAVVGLGGIAGNLAQGQVSPLFLVANGLLLLLGIAASASTIAMASPRVGSHHSGARWAMVMSGTFPAVALLLLALNHNQWPQLLDLERSWHCFADAVPASLLVAAVLLAWLRSGAPVSPKAAGMHLGVAATALGSAIYGITCPLDNVYHLGIWHVLPVIAGALAGRFLIPRLLRW